MSRKRIDPRSLDRHITGSYGEDQFFGKRKSMPLPKCTATGASGEALLRELQADRIAAALAEKP